MGTKTSTIRTRDLEKPDLGTWNADEILDRAGWDENGTRAPLGSRLAERFADVGLEHEIPELRGQPPCPADLESWVVS